MNTTENGRTPVVDASASSATQGDTALAFDSVKVHFKRPTVGINKVLDGVSLTVAPGEFCVVVGASGCGKSTLLNLAAGLLTPTSGTVTQQGVPITGINTKIGHVAQNANLIPWRTVRENLRLPLAIRRWPRAERAERVEHWINAVGLGGYGDHYPHELSGGMQKRCSIARTLVYDPDIILMDEPFGALDAMTKVVMQDELLRLWNEQKKTVMFITHDLTEAVALGDRVVAMGKNPGQIREILPVDLPRPRDVYRLMDNPQASSMHDRLWELMRDQLSEVRVA